MNIKYGILSCFVLMLTGCAATASGPLFTSAPVPLDNSGVLYVFQKVPSVYYTPLVRINNKPFIKLMKRGYSYRYLLPGVYRISFGDGGFTKEIEIRPGQEIYEEYYADASGIGSLDLTDDEASEKIKNYRYIEPF